MTGIGTPVVHRCRTDHPMSKSPVLHVVLPPRGPGSTPFLNLRNAGYEVVAVSPFPEEIPGCPVASDYPGCEQVLVRESATTEQRETDSTTK